MPLEPEQSIEDVILEGFLGEQEGSDLEHVASPAEPEPVEEPTPTGPPEDWASAHERHSENFQPFQPQFFYPGNYGQQPQPRQEEEIVPFIEDPDRSLDQRDKRIKDEVVGYFQQRDQAQADQNAQHQAIQQQRAQFYQYLDTDEHNWETVAPGYGERLKGYMEGQIAKAKASPVAAKIASSRGMTVEQYGALVARGNFQSMTSEALQAGQSPAELVDYYISASGGSGKAPAQQAAAIQGAPPVRNSAPPSAPRPDDMEQILRDPSKVSEERLNEWGAEMFNKEFGERFGDSFGHNPPN